MSDFTIAATDAPQYNPYAPLSAMGQLAQQNQAVQSGAIQNQSALLNLSLQKARLQPVISALQGYGQGQQQPSSSGLAGMAQNAPPVAPGQPMNSGAAGPGGNVTSQPLAAPGGGQGTPVGLAPGGPPPGTPSGGSDGGGYQLPPGAGDMSQGLIGVAVPVLALAGAMGGSDPTGDIQKLVQTRAQWLETGAQQANTPQAWNSFVMSAYQNGWATSADAGKLLNNFGMRDSVLKSYASPDEQLKATAELAGGGMGFDPTTGTIGPNANAISAAGDKAGAVEGGQILAQTQLKPGEIAAETPGLVARAGGEAAAGEAAKAPYTPVSVPVRNADGSTTSVTMPSSQYAATYGGVGGGAAAAGGRPNDTNPGNIRAPGGGFRTYDSPQAGVLAMSDTLQGYGNQGVNTIAGVVGKYAPPSENDTSAYVAAVSKATGFAPDQKIDLSDPNVRYKVMQAMLPRERGNGAAALAGLGGGSGAAPASGGAAAPPPAAGGAPSGPPTDGPIPTNPVAGPPLPASNTGANPNVVPNGITPGPGQVAAPPVPAAPAATPPAAAPTGGRGCRRCTSACCAAFGTTAAAAAAGHGFCASGNSAWAAAGCHRGRLHAEPRAARANQGEPYREYGVSDRSAVEGAGCLATECALRPDHAADRWRGGWWLHARWVCADRGGRAQGAGQHGIAVWHQRRRLERGSARLLSGVSEERWPSE